MKACSGNRRHSSKTGLGGAGKAAVLVGYQEALLQPWPGHPGGGDDDNSGLAKQRWARLLWFPACLLASQCLPLICSCSQQMLQEEPHDTSTKAAFISIGSSVSFVSHRG